MTASHRRARVTVAADPPRVGWVEVEEAMLPDYKNEALLRLKIAAGHLDAVRRMVDEDAYCIELMKQLAAVQGNLRRVQQVFLRNHLSSCVSEAVRNGMGEAILDELMSALKYDTSLIDGRGVTSADAPAIVVERGPQETAATCCRTAGSLEVAAP